jgi:cobaltochelatase CobN
MDKILSGPTNWLTDRKNRNGGVRLSLKKYNELFKELPFDVRRLIEDKWGKPEQDPFVGNDGFALSILKYGNIIIGIQPARGYNIDPKETYHSPDLVPPHNYLAFYFWLRYQFECDAFIHMGKHGNLEWLPGKALALSENCFPEVTLGVTPNIYPFIVNDPGEGTQAKRRSSAVIIDHLTPPLTRAETYGPLKELEALVDEYYEAAGIDPNRINYLRKEILSLTSASGLDIDVGMEGDDSDADLAKLDAYLCELKEAQIRDGLHIFGQSPEGRLERDLIQALVRIPRDKGEGADASLIRALATDFGLSFDPLNCTMSDAWTGVKPLVLENCLDEKWRSHGDTVERLEIFASKLIDGVIDFSGKNSDLVMKEVNETVRPVLRSCGSKEHLGILTSLNGNFIQPGASGAPTRGRLDVLPTGRNFFSVDNRAVPTPTAWALGWKSANLLLEKHLQNNGDWPKSLLITAWGTANMRTGGDDIAQALALMGVKPKWDLANRRVTGFEILPLSILDRPRVDVTLRVSGFFRDAFPQLISLIDSAALAVMKLDEPFDMNPAKAATDGSKHRVFGSKPGAYGAGLQAMIDERLWNNKEDLSEAYLSWGSYAYGSDVNGIEARKAFENRLSGVEAIVQNQDNREHDILDSDDYYQFEGGAAAAVKTLQGRDRPIYHNDHSRPENPVIRTLEEEIGRVVRSRVVNPKWIDGVKRHGYKGAFEMAATLDYLFAFSATTGAVANHHFDLVYQAFIENEENRQFIIDNNTPAFGEIIDRFQEAIDRELWAPKSNSAQNLLKKFKNEI